MASKIARGPGRPSRYRLEGGATVPGVTTVCNRFKDSGGLIHWAYTCGVEGVDYRRTRDDAGDSGNLAHDMIEAHIHGEEFNVAKLGNYDPLVVQRAKNAFGNFLSWSQTTKLELIATELPIVSERHRFGGTLDAIGRILGNLCLVDWKTSNGVYADYLAQVAAYVILYEEKYPGERIEEVHLLRFDKEYDGSHHHRWGRAVIDDAWKYFEHALHMFELDKRLKKAAA